MGERPTLCLLGTQDCSLCDAALDLLMSMPELRGARLQVVDIVHLDEGVDRYGSRIPVLLYAGHELDGPLTRERVSVWYLGMPHTV